jgi:hypothetical protein
MLRKFYFYKCPVFGLAPCGSLLISKLDDYDERHVAEQKEPKYTSDKE